MPTWNWLTFMCCQPCLPNFQCFQSCVSWTLHSLLLRLSCHSLRNVSFSGLILGLIKSAYHGCLNMMTSSEGLPLWSCLGPPNPKPTTASAIKVSGFKPTLKVYEHNRVAHASMAPDKGHLLEELGWMTCVAWKKQRREEIKKAKAQRTEDKWNMTRTSSDLVGLLISFGNIWYGLIMHFCDSNHEITRSSKRKYNNTKDH